MTFPIDPKKAFKLLRKALADPVFFCTSPYFLNIKPYPKQAEVLREFYSGNYNELVLVCGMRSGKSTLMCLFAIYETFLFLMNNYRDQYNIPHFTPVFGLMAAAKQKQATVILFATYTGLLHNSPFFDQITYVVRKDHVTFPEQNFHIRAVCSTAATEVGRTAKFVVLDEVGRMELTVGRRSGLELYRALTKSTRTFKKDGHRFCCGSPTRPDDLLMTLYKRDDPHTLRCRYTTWEFNPHITRADLQD